MCSYCTCQENDNTRYHGMRLKPLRGDYFDRQSDESYSWTGAPVTNYSGKGGIEKVPLVGTGTTTGPAVARPVQLGTDGK